MDKKTAFTQMLASFEGRRALYLESGYLCVVEFGKFKSRRRAPLPESSGLPAIHSLPG